MRCYKAWFVKPFLDVRHSKCNYWNKYIPGNVYRGLYHSAFDDLLSIFKFRSGRIFFIVISGVSLKIKRIITFFCFFKCNILNISGTNFPERNLNQKLPFTPLTKYYRYLMAKTRKLRACYEKGKVQTCRDFELITCDML